MSHSKFDLAAVVRWASHQPEVSAIEAETEPNNIASQRVLEKVGFVPLGVNGVEGPRFVWNDRSSIQGESKAT